MALNAQAVRNAVPVPRLPSPRAAALIGLGLFLLGAIWLYDGYDGAGRQGPWPLSTLFPW